MSRDHLPPQAQLDAYANALRRWNAKFNLISRQDEDRIEVRHIADSLSLLELIPEDAGSLLDVGSGAGLPGLILAIARPDLAVCLIDRSARKCRFLRQMVTELDLENVSVECEDVAQYRGGPFAVVTSRAVTDIETFWRWALPLLTTDGLALHMSQTQPLGETLRIAHGQLRQVWVEVAGLDRAHLVSELRREPQA